MSPLPAAYQSASRDVPFVRCPRGERKTWRDKAPVKARASLHTGLRCAYMTDMGCASLYSDRPRSVVVRASARGAFYPRITP